jgi:hypothetical protein
VGGGQEGDTDLPVSAGVSKWQGARFGGSMP